MPAKKGSIPANKGKRFYEFEPTKAEREARLKVASSWRDKFQAAKVIFTDEQKMIYLRNLAETGRKGESAEKAGVSIQTVVNHRARDPEFNEACEHAFSMYGDMIHTHATKLMVEGVQKPLLGGRFKDMVVAHETEYATNLLAMELRRSNPEYKDRQELDVNVKGGVLVAPAGVNPADWIAAQNEENSDRRAPEQQIVKSEG